jgi:CheY-like chemotaxis protein
VQNVHGAFTERNYLPDVIETIDRRLRLDMKAEHPALFHHAVVQELIRSMEPDIDSQARLGRANTGDVIEMRVGQQNVPDLDSFAFGGIQQSGHFVSRIDQHSLAGLLAGYEVTVLVERRLGGSSNQHVQYDLAMIIAVVDDLLFGSKIRAAARTAGATISFARGRDAVAAAVRDNAAELILIDLEGQSGDAIEMIRSLRAEVGAGVRIIAFGSHVNVERLEAARQAGCDQALARSAFVNLLPRLLSPSGAGAR